MTWWLAALIAILAAGPLLALVFALRARRRVPAAPARPPRAGEPCWTEDIASDRRYAYGRAQCVNDELMEADERMRWEVATWGAGG